MNQKLLSIIVPVYNVENSLCRCLESLVNQTYQEIEIILVDDGSTDNSRRICEEWAMRDDRIVLSEPKQNEGLAEARNIGMKLSHGKYLAFVDSDDYLENYAYEKMVLAIEKDKSDFSLCNFWNYKEDTGEKVSAYKRMGDYKNCVLEGMLLEHLPTSAWCKVLKREVMLPEDERPIWFPKGRRYEDTVVSFKQALKAEKVSVIEEPLYYYVKSRNTITAEPKRQDVRDIIQNTGEIRKLLNGMDLEGLAECYITSTLVFDLQLFYRLKEKDKEDKKQILKELSKSVHRISLSEALRSEKREKLLLCKIGIIDLAARIYSCKYKKGI